MLSSAKLVAFVATADASRSRAFYEGVLGLRVIEDQPYSLVVESAGVTIRIQKVEKVEARGYTALGWQVSDAPTTVRALAAKGVEFERYPGMDQDDLGIWRSPSGALVAWFKDPDGNVLSITG